MSTVQWTASGEYSDILYHKAEGIARITINRPEVRNAFRPQTVEQMIAALSDARNDETIGVVILTGAERWLSARVETRRYEATQAMPTAKG